MDTYKGMVMTRFDDWLTTDDVGEYEAAKEDYVYEKKKQLMRDMAIFHVNDFQNFMEDIYEASPTQIETIEECLRTRDFAHLGRTLWSICVDKREQAAIEYAEALYDEGERE